MRTNELVFYRDVFGGWRWEFFDVSGEASDAQSSFDTRSECVADARRSGLIRQRRGSAVTTGGAKGPRRRVADRPNPGAPTSGASSGVAAQTT